MPCHVLFVGMANSAHGIGWEFAVFAHARSGGFCATWAATVMWLSGTPRDVANCETGLKGQMLEIVAAGDTDLKDQKRRSWRTVRLI